MGTSMEEALPFLASTEHIRRDSLSLVQGEAAAIQPREPTKSRSLLYTSHFLSAWNCRLFEFGAVLFLAEAFPDTLLPSSIYAFVRAAAVIGFSPVIGDYIDIMDRLVVLRISIISQTMAVIVSCLVFLLIFAFEDSSLAGIQPLSLILLCLMAPIEKLASVMNSISIEKDWAVVIAKSDEIDLENINSQMRRIDLLCKLLGPLFIALVDGFSTRVAIWVVLVLSGFSVMLEYYTIAIVYSSVPALQAAPATSETDANKIQALNFSQALKILRPISVYLQHPAFLPSIALSSLYFTVLSFSGQMITYLVSSGFAPTHVGIMRTTAAVFELSATWLAPWAIKQVGPIRAGLWSINWQLVCLIPTVILFFALVPPVNAALALIGGVIASRVGLWSFDLSVQIIVQESVDVDARGAFSSMEASAQNLFELCAYLLTIIFSRPDQFHYPIVASIFAVIVANGLYTHYVRQSRGHLIHVSKCMGGGKRAAVSQQNQQAATESNMTELVEWPMQNVLD